MKKNILIVYGGKSLEHDISIKTSKFVTDELNKSELYNIFTLFISQNNELLFNNSKIFDIGNGQINNISIDLAFLCTHGGNTEDGNLQGFFEIMNIKYTGCDIIGSVLGLNKSLTKIICKENNIPIVEYYKLYKNDDYKSIIKNIKNLKYKKFIIKINNGGSSIGSFFSNIENLEENIEKAFKLCDIILVEKCIDCKEYTILLMGKYPNLKISNIGEYVRDKSYKLSLDGNHKPTFKVNINSSDILNNIIKQKIINYSTILYKELHIKNYARFDFFLTNKNELFFNEVNTLPSISKNSIISHLNNNMKYIDLLNFIINCSI